jgi:hypothetical protein
MTAERAGETEKARAALAAALDELEYRLNLPARARARISRMRAERPAAFVGIAAGAALVAGTVVWLVVRPARR